MPKEERKYRKRNYSQISSYKSLKKRRKLILEKAPRKSFQKQNDMQKSEYKVENVIAHGIECGQLMFLIKWKGWSDKYNTWEPLQNLENCKEIISNYASGCLTHEALNELSTQLGIDSNLSRDMLESLIPRGGFDALLDKFTLQLFLMKLLLFPPKEGHSKKIAKGKKYILQYFLHLRRENQLIKLKEWETNIEKVSIETAIIKVENNVDLEEPPSGFVYINDYIPSGNIIIPNDPPIGCECEMCCYKEKNCCGNQSCFPYSKKGRINVAKGTPVYECNKRCKCGPECHNRIVQKGRKIPLAIYRTNNGCGWGVKTLRKIYCGEFICEYVGEIITYEEAERRGQIYDSEGRTYLFDLDFNSSENPYTVDAATYGNVSHFINHSCDPNLGVWAIWINCLDPNLPKLALFALRDIEKNEQLTFDYMANNSLSKPNTPEKADTPNKLKLNTSEEEGNNILRLCKCEANKCRRYLF